MKDSEHCTPESGLTGLQQPPVWLRVEIRIGQGQARCSGITPRPSEHYTPESEARNRLRPSVSRYALSGMRFTSSRVGAAGSRRGPPSIIRQSPKRETACISTSHHRSAYDAYEETSDWPTWETGRSGIVQNLDWETADVLVSGFGHRCLAATRGIGHSTPSFIHRGWIGGIRVAGGETSWD
ncbi:hypothetical protein AWZ03_015062 [Drosophila navojoa]|uniref:Uncharacterized protein n=1 Tax=Drosophila navojoa TaxID=7232 RepID=A0A484APN3_DRONA|nr:hypothetical protein AWZ03_015062 [Drosophila navojoa]